MKLYEIPIEANEIEAVLADSYGELTPEIQSRIEDFLKDGKDKIESAAMVVRSLEADAEICKAEAERLMKRAQGLEKGADHLKGLILFAVDEGFGGKVKTAKFTVWGQTSAPVTAFYLKQGKSIYEVPPQFMRTHDPELDKKALKDAYSAGLELPESVSVMTAPGTRYLRIK